MLKVIVELKIQQAYDSLEDYHKNLEFIDTLHSKYDDAPEDFIPSDRELEENQFLISENRRLLIRAELLDEIFTAYEEGPSNAEEIFPGAERNGIWAKYAMDRATGNTPYQIMLKLHEEVIGLV